MLSVATATLAAARRTRRPLLRSAAALALVGLPVVLVACAEDDGIATAPAASTQVRPGVHRQYGAPVQVGDGRARAYVVVDQRGAGRAVEFGVALDERAMQGLPPGGGHARHPGDGGPAMPNTYLRPPPAQNPTAIQLVELNWNANGHEPPGVYDAPHFDFHFYTIPRAERDAIDPATMPDAEYVARSMNYPAAVAP